MTTNTEVLRLAREITAEQEGDPTWKKWTLDGTRDHTKIMKIVIAAIERTTSLGALWLRTNPDAAHKPHDAFERYDHLRQSEKDNSDAT